MKVVTVAQQKGGSGKTTVTVGLACEFRRRGMTVSVIDLDPQGSLGQWFMRRLDRDPEAGGIGFSTASAWGVGYEARRQRDVEIVLIDTPPKIDGDLKPALREADLVVVPVTASEVDLWATEGVLDLAAREGKRPLAVLNRARAGTRLTVAMRAALAGLAADPADTVLAQRVAHAEAMGAGQGVCERSGAQAAAAEMAALADEVLARLG